jgi:hypothetical protein
MLALLEIKFKCNHGFPVISSGMESNDSLLQLNRDIATGQSYFVKCFSLVNGDNLKYDLKRLHW